MLAESPTPELTRACCLYICFALSDRASLVPPWASVGELEEVDQRLARIKADLLSELVAVCSFSTRLPGVVFNHAYSRSPSCAANSTLQKRRVQSNAPRPNRH